MKLSVRRFATLLAVALWVLALAGAQGTRFDLVIRGGRVLDGTGNPWFVADIGLRDGRVAAIGNLDGAAATRAIDATGKFIAPGFIDLHSHSDRGLAVAELRYNLNMIAQGITLSVVNQDGRCPTWPLPSTPTRL